MSAPLTPLGLDEDEIFLSYFSLVGIGGIFRANIIRSWAVVVNKGWQVGEIKSTENNFGQKRRNS